MEPSRITLLWFCFVAYLAVCYGQITFTGNAKYDFDPLRLPPEARRPYFVYRDPISNRLGQSDRMIQNDWISGMDVENIFVQYDWRNDVLYVGIDCFGICGDLDGDGIINGDPSVWESGMNDYPDWTLSKTFSMVVWPEPPKTWYFPPVNDVTVDLGERMGLFYPTFVVGKQPTTNPAINLAAGFDAFSFSLNTNLDPSLADCPNTPIPYAPGSPCYNAHVNILLDPPTGYRLNLTRFAGRGVFNFPFTKPIPRPGLAFNPTADHPDIEFTLGNFSNFFNFTFQPGYNPIRFGFYFQMGSTNNLLGFKTIIPQLFSVPCALQDACGVCIAEGGDNSSCADCSGQPHGNKRYDICGVCNGDGKSCADCRGRPHGTAVYDSCGVCGGDNSTCSPCPQTSILTFYAEDTWIEMNDRDKNHGDEEELKVAWNRSRTLVQFRDLQYEIKQTGALRFGIPPTRLEVLDAKLRIHVRSAGCEWTDPEIAVHRLNVSFSEQQATWECSDLGTDSCCSQWRMSSLPPAIHPSFVAKPIATEELTDGAADFWLEFNVTDEVIDLLFHREFCSVHSYLVKKVCEHSPGCATFDSCESDNCPELVVKVKVPCPEQPEAPETEPCEKEDPSLNWNWDNEEDKRKK